MDDDKGFWDWVAANGGVERIARDWGKWESETTQGTPNKSGVTDRLVKKATENNPFADIPPLYDPSWFPDGIGDKVYVPEIHDWLKSETTQGTAPRLVNTDLPESVGLTPEAGRGNLGWYHITIPEEDEDEAE